MDEKIIDNLEDRQAEYRDYWGLAENQLNAYEIEMGGTFCLLTALHWMRSLAGENGIGLEWEGLYQLKHIYPFNLCWDHFADEIPCWLGDYPLFSPEVVNGSYVLLPTGAQTDTLVIHKILKGFISNETEWIIELGSGYGDKLLTLYHMLGKQAAKYQFAACEFTDLGLQLNERLIRMAGINNMQLHAFDYLKADYSWLPPGANVLVFTSHSIERIGLISGTFLERMFDRAEKTTVVHFEPVGWQRVKYIRQRNMDYLKLNDQYERERFKERYSQLNPHADFKAFSMSDESMSLNSANYAAMKDYNADLLNVLEGLFSERQIKILYERYDLYGYNCFNPWSVIAYQNPM